MKVIIDIDENVFTRLFDNGKPTDIADGIIIERAIRNGTPIHNVTNGKVLKIMFPNIENQMIDLVMRCGTSIKRIGNDTWMNLPYQKGDTNENNI